MTTFKSLLLVSATSMAVLAPFGASAQDAPQATAPDEAPLIEEVVVRANKGARVEDVQDVPLAVTAVSAATIDQIQAVNVIDVSRLAPNTTFTTAATLPGFANFQIRGIGNSGSTGTIDPAVNIVVDGMVYDFQGGTVLDAFDLESVEILRGPQGVLAGRNTTGGAVLLRTRRPTGEFGSRAEVTIGDHNRFDVAGSIEGSLIPDQLFAKLAVLKRWRDGSFEDKNGGTFVAAPFNPTGAAPLTITETQADTDTLAIRPTLVWSPTSAFDLTLLGEYVEMSGGSSGAQPVRGLDASGVRYDNLLITRFGYVQPTGEWANNSNFEGFSDIKATRLVAEMNWDVGPGVITSISGIRDVDYGFGFDSDGTPFTLLEFPDNRIDSRQYSEELRFASTFSETLDFVVGAYFDHHKLQTVERRRQSNLVAAPTAATYSVSRLQGVYTQKSDSAAAFFNVNWRPVEQLTLTAGGRYSHEKKKLDIAPLGLCTGGGAVEFSGCPSVFSQFSKSWSDFSPKVGVQYEFNEDAQIYATWTKGFRSGVYNGRATNVGQVGPTDPESATSSEIGLKTTFWDRRARLNVAGFHTKYDDIIRTVLVGALQVPQNAASATIKGVEIEGILRPNEAWEFRGNVGWTDAQYDEFVGLSGFTPAAAKALKFDKVPEWTAYVSATYFFDAMGAEWAARASYSYRDDYFVDVVNSAFAHQDAYGMLDASLSAERDNWKVTIFGKNLTDEHAIELANRLFVPIQYGGDARSFGVTLNYRY